jgi:hypothetical protein
VKRRLAQLAGAALAAGLGVVVLVVPGGEPPDQDHQGARCPKLEQRVSERTYWLHKWLEKSDVRLRLGEPERVDDYGLLSFWRYPCARTIIFDGSGRVIGWENF